MRTEWDRGERGGAFGEGLNRKERNRKTEEKGEKVTKMEWQKFMMYQDWEVM